MAENELQGSRISDIYHFKLNYIFLRSDEGHSHYASSDLGRICNVNDF